MRKGRRASEVRRRNNEGGGEPGAERRGLLGDEKDLDPADGVRVRADVVRLERADAAVAAVVVGVQGMQRLAAERQQEKDQQQRPGATEIHG